MSYNGEMSPADYAAVSGNNDGFGNGNGWWIILLFLIWGRGGWGGYGSEGGAANNYVLASDFATIQRQLSDGFNSIDNALDRQNAGICDLGYTSLNLNNQTNMNILQSANSLQAAVKDCCCTTQQNLKDVSYNIATTGAGIQASIKDCCCENEKIAMQNRFDMAQYNCQTQQAIDKVGDRIIDYLAQDKAQALRDENQALRLAASQAAQNNYLVNQLRPCPIPAYITCNPYSYQNGCGCGYN